MEQQVIAKLEGFFTRFKHRVYRKGEILVRADDDPSGIFYLKQGFVKEYAISKKGDEVVINIFKPISFFPMSWAINKTPNNYYFEALSDLAAWVAPKEEVVAFVKREPEILFDLLRRVYIGTDGLLVRMMYLMSGSAQERLITELLISAKRFGERNASKIDLHMTEVELATRSGMTRETISRELKKLKDERLVTFNNHTLVIPSIDKLEAKLVE